MGALPSGTVTFLFTDVEESTRLFQELGDDFTDLLRLHYEVMRVALKQHGGVEVKTLGDGFFAAFASAGDAVAGALAAQLGHRGKAWPANREPRIRMGLHTGTARPVGDDYAALAVHQAARVSATGHGGQVVVSDATRQVVGGGLDAVSFIDLGEHRLKDLNEPMRLFQLSHPDLAAEFPPLRTLDLVPHNLPVQLTSFVGREAELREVRKILAESRIVTLSGAGGCGKTRLALQLGAEVATDFAGGVWFVDLASLADPALVLSAIGGALRLQEAPGRELIDIVAAYLGAADRLLILDNCEHVLDRCAELVAILVQRCPSLKILATSREALRVGGEAAWRVPSLAFEEESEGDDVVASPAVRLFLERAHEVAPDVAIHGPDLGSVGRICRRLDGIPLAIELAAARMDALNADQIERRLDNRFRLLAGGSRAAMERQRTLRAAVDWSYELLDASEKTLLARLSVFAGTFSLEAAESVCAGEPLADYDVLDAVAGLTRKSLVTTERDADGVWYRLTETVRQYAVEKLGDEAAITALRQAHLAFYCEFASRFGEVMHVGGDQRQWLATMDREIDNVYAALDWGATADPESAASTLWGVRFYWETRGRLREGQARAATLVDTPGLSSVARVKALIPAAAMAARLGNLATAERWAGEARALAEAAGETRLQAHASMTLSNIVYERDVARAEEILREAMALACQSGDESLRAVALGNDARYASDRDAAAWLTAQAVSIFRRLGNVRAEVSFSQNLAIFVEGLGRLDEAAELHEKALAGARELGYKAAEARTLGVQGRVRFARGYLTEGERLLRESVRMLDDLGESVTLVDRLWQLLDVLEWSGDSGAMRQTAQWVVDLGRGMGNPVIELGGRLSLAIQDGDPTAALEFAEKALEYDTPDRNNFVLWRAECAVLAESIPGMTRARAELGSLDLAIAPRAAQAMVRLHQSAIALITGDTDTAFHYALLGLSRAVDSGNIARTCKALLTLAGVEAQWGNGFKAGHRLGAAEAIVAAIGGVLPADLAHLRDLAVAASEPHELEPSRAAARAMSREQAEDFARRLVAGEGTADLEELEVP